MKNVVILVKKSGHLSFPDYLKFESALMSPKKVIILCFIGIINLSVAQTTDDYRRSINSAGGIENFLKKLSQELSKTLPRAKDQFTDITSVSSSGRTISFYMKFKNVTRDQIINNPSAIKEVERQSINSLCSLPLSKIIINEYDATYKYIVLSRDDVYSFEYLINRAKCPAN